MNDTRNTALEPAYMDTEGLPGQESLISVIIPAYNASRYIGQCLDSVCAQTYGKLEIIVSDDCSSDDTRDIVRSYAERDPRIRLVTAAENSGAAAARNAGTAEARGVWTALIDSDDMWEPDKLEKQMALIREKQCGFTFTGSAFMDLEGRRLGQVFHIPERVDKKELLKQNVISCSSVLLKTEYLRRHLMQQGDLHEDYLTWLRILDSEVQYACGIDEPLLVYRVSPDSRSGNKLKAAVMTFRVYRKLGMSLPESVRCWFHYVCRSMRKYRRLGR